MEGVAAEASGLDVRNVQHMALVDGDTRRRAAISHHLLGRGHHVEPFESVTEFGESRSRANLILIHDREDAVSELSEMLAASGTWRTVVAFDEEPTVRQIVTAAMAGAVGYVIWPFDEEQLSHALRDAVEQARSLGSSKLRKAAALSRINGLSRREQEVLGAVAAGCSNRAIAEQLGISPRTVEIHRANMLDKIGARSTSDAIRMAIEADLSPPQKAGY
jgi:FixJ family two-component response regulator